MLVLSRKAKQWIRIGDDIWVGVAELRGGHVRLAIEAPRDVPVIRAELTDQLPPGLAVDKDVNGG